MGTEIKWTSSTESNFDFDVPEVQNLTVEQIVAEHLHPSH